MSIPEKSLDPRRPGQPVGRAHAILDGAPSTLFQESAVGQVPVHMVKLPPEAAAQ